MKKILIILFSCFLIISIGIVSSLKYLFSDDPEYVVNFIKNNPQNVSLVIEENDRITFDINGDKVLPVASLFKVIVLYELINQVNQGSLAFNDKINMNEIENYNYSNRTNPTYSIWKKEKIKSRDQVSIKEIAIGMMTYSANPNTDYLIHRLGIDQVNETAKRLTNNRHTKILPIGASVLVPYYLINEKKMKESRVKDLLKNVKKNEYEDLVFETYNYLNSNSEKKTNIDYYPSEREQIVWSKHGPRSTSLDYINIMDDLIELEMPNGIELSDLMQVDGDPSLNLIGKNGATIDSVNKIVYLDGKSKKRSVILLTHNLRMDDQMKLKNSIDNFMIKTITNEYTFSRK